MLARRSASGANADAMKSRTPRPRTLDRIDLKILQTLQADSRITNRDLARLVALSPSACLARVKKLEAEGIITGYHAAIRTELFRPTMFGFVEITVKRHLIAEFDRFDAELRQMPQVVEAFRVSGAIDYLLKILVADIQEWRAIAQMLLREEYGVEKMASHIVVADAKLFEGFPIHVDRAVRASER
jgi:DNA-binding Lrp family transcriptional regulator